MSSPIITGYIMKTLKTVFQTLNSKFGYVPAIISFERRTGGIRRVYANGELVGGLKMRRNVMGAKIYYGVNIQGMTIEGRSIRFLLRLMGVNV